EEEERLGGPQHPVHLLARAGQGALVVQDDAVDVADQRFHGSLERDGLVVGRDVGREAPLSRDAAGERLGRVELPVGQEHAPRNQVLRARHRLRGAEEREAWHDAQYRRSPLEIMRGMTTAAVFLAASCGYAALASASDSFDVVL